MKSKQLSKGLDELMDEGVAQLFTRDFDGAKIVGTVGALQFDVIQYRLEHEYGARCRYEPVNLRRACWVSCTKPAEIETFKQRRRRETAHDQDGKLVFLAESEWSLKMVQENHPEISFHFTSEG
jgi:peptide chain release factor 3